MIDNACEEIPGTKGDSASEDTLEPSGNSIPSGRTESKQQQSANESARASRPPILENSLPVPRQSPQDSPEGIASGRRIGDDSSSSMGDKQHSSDVPANSTDGIAKRSYIEEAVLKLKVYCISYLVQH